MVLSESGAIDGFRDMQLLRVGNFFSEKYGNFKINSKMLSEMVDNFKSNIRGVLPALDYSHDSEGIAAGWIKELFLSEDQSSLWAKVELTPKGAKRLSDKEFAYLSAEFDPNYVTNEIPLKKVGAVLLGAALTNRPVIKNMNPAIELSEGDKMNIEEMEKELGEAKKKLADMEVFKKKLMKDSGIESEEDLMKMIMELKGQKELMEGKEKELGEVKEKLELSEKKLAETKKENEFTVMLSEGKVCAAQKEAFIKGDMVEFVKNAQAMNLSEKGHGNNPTDENVDPEEKVLELAKEMSSSKKISLSEAMSKVIKENPSLAKKLQEKN